MYSKNEFQTGAFPNTLKEEHSYKIGPKVCVSESEPPDIDLIVTCVTESVRPLSRPQYCVRAHDLYPPCAPISFGGSRPSPHLCGTCCSNMTFFVSSPTWSFVSKQKREQVLVWLHMRTVWTASFCRSAPFCR